MKLDPAPGSGVLVMPSIGDIVGQFKLVRQLGQGGMGTVFEAVHTRIKNKRAAVKVLHPELAAHKDTITRFEREAEAATAIGHDGIIDIYDLGQCHDGAPFIIMELLKGQSLTDALKEDDATGISEPQDVPFSVFVTCSVLSALSAVHEAGIVHRDLKPDNVFLVETGSNRPKVKLLDFGIARVSEESADRKQNTLTRTGTVLGTPYFMSPEQALGLKDKVDRRSDIWAVGVILYKCLTGRYPFEGENYNQVMAQIISDRDPAEPGVLNPVIPETLEKVVMRAIRKDLNTRYPTAAAMLDDLRPFLGDTDLGLLEYHARASSRHSAAEMDTMLDGESFSDAVAAKPQPQPPQPPASLSTLGDDDTTRDRRRPVWRTVVLTLAVVAVLGIGGGAAALVWKASRADEPPATARPPAPPPVPAASVARPAVTPTPQPVAQPAALPVITAPVPTPPAPQPAEHRRDRDESRHPSQPAPPVVAASPAPAPVEPQVQSPPPVAQPAETPPEPERSHRRDPPRAQPPRPPPYTPPRPPSYGHEVPTSRPPTYGQEL
jgi:serine/threonine-protein kinase